MTSNDWWMHHGNAGTPSPLDVLEHGILVDDSPGFLWVMVGYIQLSRLSPIPGPKKIGVFSVPIFCIFCKLRVPQQNTATWDPSRSWHHCSFCFEAICPARPIGKPVKMAGEGTKFQSIHLQSFSPKLKVEVAQHTHPINILHHKSSLKQTDSFNAKRKSNATSSGYSCG